MRMDSQVLHPAKKMVGRAFTVQFMPTRPDLDAVLNAKASAGSALYNQTALDMLQPGDVLVVDLFGKVEGRHDRRRQSLLLHDEDRPRPPGWWWTAAFAIWKASPRWICPHTSAKRTPVS